MANSIFYRIIVPTDFSTCSEEAWRLVRRVAAGAGGELILTHVLSGGAHAAAGRGCWAERKGVRS